MCKESKGLINLADKLGRTPLLAGLMAGAGLEAVMELLVRLGVVVLAGAAVPDHQVQDALNKIMEELLS